MIFFFMFASTAKQISISCKFDAIKDGLIP